MHQAISRPRRDPSGEGTPDLRGVLYTAAPGTIAHVERVVHAVLAHRVDTGEAIDALLAADPSSIVAHASRGFGLAFLLRRDLAGRLRASLAAAERSLESRGGTDAEHALVDALFALSQGRPFAALDVLDRRLARSPNDLLALKLGHSLHFLVGDSRGMRVAIDAALAAQPSDLRGRGFALGCQAFALVETGESALAEERGRLAVELQPEDAWGVHAVGHVLETRGDARAGVRWLERAGAALTSVNNFDGHLAWHQALFHLALGEDEDALALYDARVAPRLGLDYRDLVNAATLLHRLSSRGCSLGERPAQVASVSSASLGDHASPFADVHHALALAALDPASARAFADSMRRAAVTGEDWAASVGRVVGCDVVDAIVALGAGDAPAAARELSRTRKDWPLLGGSCIQREILTLLVTEAERATAR